MGKLKDPVIENSTEIIVRANLEINHALEEQVERIGEIIKDIKKEHNGNCTLLEINISNQL